MFLHSASVPAAAGTVEVRFTDTELDLQGTRDGFAEALARLEATTGACFARMTQVHGDVVHEVADDPGPGPRDDVPTGDGLVTARPGVGLMVRVADCVPVVLADPGTGALGVAHAGREGVRLGVVTRTVARLRELGAGPGLRAWVGPHVCGSCYEVPVTMRAEVAAVVPATWSTTRQGTPGLDLGAGVVAQLDAAGVDAELVGGCTLEDPAAHSYRRDGAASGRLAGLVWTAGVA
ncbi:polyphenol oxidase family protein [Nocardioides sp. CFH 31398]|uniref:polyphenol oxidase family protein n=1 Tax=Nocardioides sp. CFH 31398 TaxID=2919579 RepID=UPI001F06A6BF|nr:polyphenol oxidase family protein [Nocardioides sp. CFH 31398]MCH1868283.1 polyphenol oxidase family protein [Nocardioides sp. CFH 31398]